MTNNNNYERNKLIFTKLIGNNYVIIKDTFDKSILTIKQPTNKNIKCKYILFLVIKNNVFKWSDENQYIDNYTREITKNIKYIISQQNINININTNKTNNIDDILNFMIHNQITFNSHDNKQITCNWILINKHSDTIEYYMITDIIYY